ncbi:Hypothetical predicted protein [Marmota monax]|uniref:Uncharacterized protein n=1 Tax=Marmota monax TaxID=9995 RepID=A0A5E4BZA6_MARMO|nr:hypothetical protein GHT09_014814 [Marmota monax]VTJ74239.1 Hypothetical predicted protein [Marmota monax]
MGASSCFLWTGSKDIANKALHVTNQLARRSRERVAASPSREGGNARVALGSGTHPRSIASPAGRLRAEVRQVARVSGAAKSRPTESVAQLCCGTRAAGSAAPATELGLPPRGAPTPRPRGARGSRGGAAREHLGRAPAAGAALPELRAVPRPALAALSASRCGGRGSRAGVTAPPARPPPGCRRGCGQPAETAKEEAPRRGQSEERASRAGTDASVGVPQLRLASFSELGGQGLST